MKSCTSKSGTLLALRTSCGKAVAAVNRLYSLPQRYLILLVSYPSEAKNLLVGKRALALAGSVCTKISLRYEGTQMRVNQRAPVLN